ncbi:MAG: AAA family ATPase [Vicinamibacterales bacterium]
MYERFYNLRERPFSLSPDPDYLYPSRVHTEALSYLRYGIEGRAGFIVITGEIGSGKTTLLQTALRGVNTRTSVSRLVSTMLDARELIEAVMLDFGLTPEPGASKPRLLRDLGRYLVEQRVAGRLALLVIDEAQNLSLAALEEVRMLSNLETERSKLIQIALIGQPGLRALLASRELEQLRQRITVSYHLPALDVEETEAYINHRLKRAAAGVPLVFPRAVTDLIHEHSRGVPRTINVIADAVLLYGYGEGQRTIGLPITRAAIDELRAGGLLQPVETPAAAEPPARPAAPERPTAPDDLFAREERLLATQHRIVLEQSRLLHMRREIQATAAMAERPAATPAAREAGRAADDAPVPGEPRRAATPPNANAPEPAEGQGPRDPAPAPAPPAPAPGTAAPATEPPRDRDPGRVPDAGGVDPTRPWSRAPEPLGGWPGPSSSRSLFAATGGEHRATVWARLGRGFFRTALSGK